MSILQALDQFGEQRNHLRSGCIRLLHDIFFLLLVVFVIAHIYLGAGIFQPYKRSLRTMWGDGKISESDALYHWGKWAREEIEEGRVYEDKK